MGSTSKPATRARGRAWSNEEDRFLIEHWPLEVPSLNEMAAMFETTYKAVYCRAMSLGLLPRREAQAAHVERQEAIAEAEAAEQEPTPELPPENPRQPIRRGPEVQAEIRAMLDKVHKATGMSVAVLAEYGIRDERARQAVYCIGSAARTKHLWLREVDAALEQPRDTIFRIMEEYAAGETELQQVLTRHLLWGYTPDKWPCFGQPPTKRPETYGVPLLSLVRGRGPVRWSGGHTRTRRVVHATATVEEMKTNPTT